MEKISLNRFSSIPLYRQLSSNIRDQITKGILKTRELIPSEKEMASLAEVSTIVVRQAYAYLRRAGLVVTQQGKGTFVSERKSIFEFVQTLASSYEEGVKKGKKVNTVVLELKEISKISADIKNKLELSENDRLIMITRLRSINDIKMFLWTSYLPASICKPLLEEDFTKVSLYEVLREKLNIKISRAERCVEVIKADSYKAELLGISELESIFFIESIAYSEEDMPVEYYQGWYSADYTKFYFEVR